jgi:hypothetical protein
VVLYSHYTRKEKNTGCLGDSSTREPVLNFARSGRETWRIVLQSYQACKIRRKAPLCVRHEPRFTSQPIESLPHGGI